ncbi:RNA polymerase sigma-70 factor (ECF subfamily) [Paenibacillus endophyticus]|uniref:RNA polymerase sigma-70 factor (ECF subfamily) n=1 Tax=Paenibacillus endophyticus TaxID=1294268 RepID=A0A7W5GBK8_9BACL|nr:RNA polymerase sigma factor SigJ [Paenibacillus endophyticus]MBB3153503.1 RNA polymerase sigma-70 factor (ECF subfamily) [Paenibacillus endophyticus]
MQELYKQYKNLLFKLAYQLTGSVSDAEDVVQDVFLKIIDVPSEKLAEPKAYLCKMVTNRCLDLHKSARKKREQYFGEWLPEPFLSSNEDAMESVVRDDLLSYAMVVLLEKLSPSERMIFVLREALGFDYDEIAQLVEKSEANCRKLLSRARAKMGISSDELIHQEAANHEWANGFVTALKQGNLNEVMSMLGQDVVLVSDGGGKVTAAVEPIETRELVARFLLGPVRQAALIDGNVVIEIGQINGQPGLILRSNERVHTVAMLHVEGDLIKNLYVVRNPDKLLYMEK